jgi:Flp pilus assembly protein CpaB
VATRAEVPPLDLPWPADGADRAIGRRRTLPRGRAVVGGFLIALAAVVTFWAYSGANRAPRQWYVVAARALVPGTRIGPQDVRAVALNVPDAAARAQLFGSPAAVIGTSVLAPVPPGALIEANAVVGRAGAPGTSEISVNIDRSRAVGGTLKPGEFVDILSTFGQGASSSTVVMVPHVEVLAVASGDSGSEVIVLAAPDGTAAEAIADAENATQLTLVRAAEQLPGAPVTTVPPFEVQEGAQGGSS